MFFTLKKLEPAPVDRSKAEVKQARKEYARWFIEVAFISPKVIYIDESGFNTWTQCTRGRAVVGERAIRMVNSQRGQNVTLILAISAQTGIEYFSFHVGGTTVSVFQTFFLLYPRQWVFTTRRFLCSTMHRVTGQQPLFHRDT